MTDGFVVVDKPAGWTSHDAVARCRKVFGQKRVGHAGTLDPDATGVLARRARAGDAPAEVRRRSREGVRRRGRASARPPRRSTPSGEVTGRSTWAALTSTTCAPPPRSSSATSSRSRRWCRPCRSAGKRLHALARKGIEVERAPRPVTMHSLRRQGLGRTRRVRRRRRVLDRHLHPHAGRRHRRGARRRRAPAQPAAPRHRLVRRCRGRAARRAHARGRAADGRSRGAPADDHGRRRQASTPSPTAAHCSTTRSSGSSPNTWRCSTPRGELVAVYRPVDERLVADVVLARWLAFSADAGRHRLRCRTRPRRRARLGRHDRRVRRPAPRPPQRDRRGPPPRGDPQRVERDGHLRPPSGRGRAARVGAVPPHVARPEDRAARANRARPRVRGRVRRRALARDRRGFRQRSAGRRAAGARRRRRPRLPLRQGPRRQRRDAATRRRGARLRRARHAPGRHRRRSGVLDADPRPAARRRSRAGGRVCSVVPTKCAAPSCTATPAGASSASRRPTSPCPTACACPPTASTPRCTRRPTASRVRRRCRSVAGRRSTSTPRRRCSRRTSSTSTATSTTSPPAVGFVERLRGEQRFEHVDDLIKQMHADVAATRAALGFTDGQTRRSLTVSRQTALAAGLDLGGAALGLEPALDGPFGRPGLHTRSLDLERERQPFGQAPARLPPRLRSCERSWLATHPHRRAELLQQPGPLPGPSAGEFATSKTTSTRVLAVLTCWPPGPPERREAPDQLVVRDRAAPGHPQHVPKRTAPATLEPRLARHHARDHSIEKFQGLLLHAHDC